MVADPEFSRIVKIDDIGPGELKLELRADVPALAGVAERLGLSRLKELSAKVTLSRQDQHDTRVCVDFSANLVQCCVVSLEDVATEIVDTFSVIYSSERGPSDEDDDVVIDAFEDDPPEPVIDGCIDVGELVVQHLSLVIDPYPRAPGAVAPEGSEEALAEEDEAASKNPFAVLKRIRRGSSGDE
jgi:hypothetical protein